MAFLGGLLGNGLQAQAPGAVAQPQGIGGLLGGFGDQFNKVRSENPEALLALAAGLMNGNIGQGVAGMADATAAFSQDKRRSALQQEGWNRDDARFAQTFGLQQQELGMRQAELASEAQMRRSEANATADFLEKNGADPSLVGMARAGQGRAAFDLFKGMNGGGLTNSGQEVQERKRFAPQFGLVEGTPDYNRYVLTGNLPANDRGVTAGDRLAIREADDGVMAAEGADLSLQRAEELSGQAMEGAGAGMRATVANNLPTWLVPDSTEAAAKATSELDNTVTAGALEQMKAIFGGNPTEGERAILLEIQGSSSQPKAVRDAIYKRARAAVARKLQFNKDRAAELRGGTYYDAKPPQAETPAPAPSLKTKYGLE